MNKKDIIFFVILIILVSISFLLLSNDKEVKTASVYYDNEKILTLDLELDDIYEVEGYNGKVVIETNNKKIRVIEETSNKNLCSKQGYIEKSYEMIICLPNKIYISYDEVSELDGVAK